MFNSLIANELKPFVGKGIHIACKTNNVFFRGILLDVTASIFRVELFTTSGQPEGIAVGRTDDISHIYSGYPDLVRAELEFRFCKEESKTV